jgi:Flp pilus assembly CpaE family ATPase
MAVVGIHGAKGGCGVSLLATNLGISLAARESCLLIDLHAWLGYDDLLLDLPAERSWQDLLPVAGEVTQHHLDLTLAQHASGLWFLAAPDRGKHEPQRDSMTRLWKDLAGRFSWLLLDLPFVQNDVAHSAIPFIDVFLIVSTLDPPALRTAKRIMGLLPKELESKAALVLNQVTKDHPAHPASVAASIGLPLSAMLPLDPAAVGRQIHFGSACVGDPESSYGRAVGAFAARLRSEVVAGGSTAGSGAVKLQVGAARSEEEQG